MKRQKTQYTDIWIDKKRLKDPLFWHMKAWQFASTAEYIWKECKKKKRNAKIKDYGLLINAINSTPYIASLAIELFMKGYLVYKGESPEIFKNKDIGHNLKKLRIMCCKYKDKRFFNSDLVFITDKLGAQLMKGGGIRYPDVKSMEIYIAFETSLKTLEEIAGEIGKELAREM